ncbi:MAG: hypothetical protein DHS20C17_35620 [Cyclobacteriaceae bacterium]|nr:MAG: hypothetical protein DHS20C17_35620 [Cyclobacteriaceae bacterium]
MSKQRLIVGKALFMELSLMLVKYKRLTISHIYHEIKDFYLYSYCGFNTEYRMYRAPNSDAEFDEAGRISITADYQNLIVGRQDQN